jgi:hypothetical protein
MKRADTESFGPDKALVGLWFVLVAVPVPICALAVLRGNSAGWAPLLISLVLPAALVVFAVRFRVTFAEDRFIYRRWGSTTEVPYGQISHIEVTNITPVTKAAIGAFLVTRDGFRAPFWPKLFPTRAVTRFFELAPTSH